jgi:hypothetical protein
VEKQNASGLFWTRREMENVPFRFLSLIPGRYQYQGTLHKVRMSFLEISASEDPFAGPYLSAVPIVRMIVRPPRILPLD